MYIWVQVYLGGLGARTVQPKYRMAVHILDHEQVEQYFSCNIITSWLTNQSPPFAGRPWATTIEYIVQMEQPRVLHLINPGDGHPLCTLYSIV